MPSRTEIGLVVALVPMTVVGFLVGFFIPRKLGQTDSEFDLINATKSNSCEENPDLCPMGNFPTQVPETFFVRNASRYGQADNDRCCPTTPGFISFTPRCQPDYQQQTCCFPPIKYFPTQSAHIGTCSKVNQTACGAANGTCKQKKRLSQKWCRRNIILQDKAQDNKVVLTWIYVDAYCSCNNA